MKNFVLLIIQILGYVCIVASPISLLNYYFDWHIGMYDTEVPGELGFAIFILIFGLVVTGISHFLDKKFPVPK